METDRLRAHIVSVDSVAFANVQSLDQDDAPYLFFRYALSADSILTLRSVAACLFAETAFPTSEALSAFVQHHLGIGRDHLAAAPPHVPAVQVSPLVHSLPSLQAVPLATFWLMQPSTASQESAVHWLSFAMARSKCSRARRNPSGVHWFQVTNRRRAAPSGVSTIPVAVEPPPIPKPPHN